MNNIDMRVPTLTPNERITRQQTTLQKIETGNEVNTGAVNEMVRDMRTRREVQPPDDQSTSTSAQVPLTPIDALQGDLTVQPNSLIGARIIAARRLLGEESREHEDETLLELVNQLHKNAHTHPDDQTALELSRAIYAEECAVWGEQNGAAALGIPPETVVNRYQEAWELTLNPPPPPAFKTRLELAAEDIEARQLPTPLYPIPHDLLLHREITLRLMTKEEHIHAHAEESEILHKYYAQFTNYIEQHLERLCAAKTIAAAQQAGLDWLSIQHRPEQTWNLNLRLPPIVNDPIFSPRKIAQGSLMSMPGGNFGLIGPDATFHYLTKPASAENESWVSSASIQALAQNKKNDYLLEKIPLQSGLSIQELLKHQVREQTLAAIESWKDNHYNPSVGEVVMRTIIPFYETVHKLKNDPGYTLTFKDVAWDVFNLGITIASIMLSAGLLKAAGSSLHAMKAMQGASIAARVSMGIRTALAGVKTGTFLRIAGRELTDFIVPVFTATSLVRAISQGSTAFIRKGLSMALRQMNIETAKTTIDATSLLDRIYDSLYQTHYIPTVSSAKTTIDQRAAQNIPAQLFRGQTVVTEQNFLASRWGTVNPASHDDYLAACIKHTARVGGALEKSYR